MKLADALEVVARSDPGMVRSHNEDAVFVDAGLGIAILADGMGGYNAGEVASGMAAHLLASNLARHVAAAGDAAGEALPADVLCQRLIDEIAAVNLAIFNASESQPQYAGMGTTLVAAYFHDNRVAVAHLGDSRLYCLRGASLLRLTKDHSLLQEQLDEGVISEEEARYSHNKNLLTRALGVDPFVDTEVHDYAVAPGDMFLLCSDGLTDMLDDDEIAAILVGGRMDLAGAADRLVEVANANGGRDNISVVLVRVRGSYAIPRGWWQKLLARFK